MKKLSPARLMGKVLEALRRLYAITDAEEFPAHLMSVTAELLSSKYITFDQIDTATGVAINVFDRPIPMTHADFMGHWQNLYHEHPRVSEWARGVQRRF